MRKKPPIEATVRVTRPTQVSTTLVVTLHGHDGEVEEIPVGAAANVTVDLEAGDTLGIEEEWSL